MPQMGGKRRRLLGIFIQIRHGMPIHLSVGIGRTFLLFFFASRRAGLVQVPRRAGGGIRCGGLGSRGGAVIGVTFGLEFLVARVGLEIGDVDEVVDPAFDVGDGGLIGGEAPFVVDDEFERVLPAFEVVDVGEVVTGAVHGDLSRPSVEGAGDVDVAAAVLPPEDRGDGVLLERRYGGKVEGEGRVHIIRRTITDVPTAVSGRCHVRHGLI